MKKVLPFVIIVGVLLAALGGGFLLLRSPEGRTENAAGQAAGANSAVTAGPKAAPQAPQPATTQSESEPPLHVRGPANAPVLVEEYSDFQCPTCGRMHPVVRQLLAKYPQQVRLAFRHFPLATIHRHARESARAAEAAGEQGKFWEMHDLLYERQAEWSKAEPARPLFVVYAQSLGLDAARFQRDIDGSPVAMRIVAAERRALSRKLQGTPTFVVNGRELTFEESNTLDKLSAAVERALAERRN